MSVRFLIYFLVPIEIIFLFELAPVENFLNNFAYKI